MGTVLENIYWAEKNERLMALLNESGLLVKRTMDQGAEAEVIRLDSGMESFVLKVWNKGSQPDIKFQYRLLNALSDQGLPVSNALGYGETSAGEPAMLTRYDGTAAEKADKKKIARFAGILSDLHRTKIKNLTLPIYNFPDYFLPGAESQPDIFPALESLLSMIDLRQDTLIHGDFHWMNILEDGDRLTVIDWTNCQLGDPRYDLAWSLILLKIYISPGAADTFLSTYLRENDIVESEREIFETIALLRWLLLHKYGEVPVLPNTIQRVKKLIRANCHLTAVTVAGE